MSSGQAWWAETDEDYYELLDYFNLPPRYEILPGGVTSYMKHLRHLQKRYMFEDSAKEIK